VFFEEASLSVAVDNSTLTRHVHALSPRSVVRRLRSSFESGHTRSLEWRREQLEGLCRLLRDHRDELVAAVRADLGKPATEVIGGELAEAVYEANVARRNLRTWAAPRRIGSFSLPGRRREYREPLGVVLIAAPWSHPVGLLLAPLAGALAAGNCAVLRPPSSAPHAAKLLRQLVLQHLDPDAVAVVEGDESDTLTLPEERFDHIYFTGGGLLGRLATESAARFGTPTTIELLEKNACLVDADVDIRDVARRIVRGKFFHAGQTSVAPAYVLVHERRERELIEAISGAIRSQLGRDPSASPHYARIENPEQCARLAQLLGDGRAVVGGDVRLADGYIAPTVLSDVAATAKILTAEVLGPILPVFPVTGMTEAIDFVNDRGRPLALYVFSDDVHVQELAVEQCRARSVCVNGIPDLGDRALPVGDAGASGAGSHHGHEMFERFSQRKSVLDRTRGFEAHPLYPAYNRFKTRLVYWRG
jgi:aldehyde dehydrogenase (NAD+)